MPRPACDLAVLAQVVEALHQPVWLVETSGEIVHGNAAARAIPADVAEAARRASAEPDDARFAVSRVETGSSVLSLVVARATLSGRSLPPSLARIASLAARGLADKDIAQELAVPLATVRTYVRRVYARLGVRTRGELATRWLSP